MNRHLLFLCFLLFSISLGAQNYYVTAIKGEVTYNNKALKKRDKIQVKGKLVFSGKNDWIKVVGPGGIYTLEPEKKAATGSEFFAALREELFPLVRQRGSYAYNITTDGARPDCIGISSYLNYFNGHTFALPDRLKGFERDLYCIFLVEDGVVARPAKVKAGGLKLDAKYWEDITPDYNVRFSDETPEGYIEEYAAIVVVNDEQAFRSALDTARNFIHLGLDLYSCSAFDGPAIGYYIGDDKLKSDRLKVSGYAYPDVNQPEATGTLLSYFYTSNFIDHKAFDKELRFLVKKTKPSSPEVFLEDMQFDTYLEDKYGFLYLPGGLESYVGKFIERYVR